MSATVSIPNQGTKIVKNLGWLLKNWRLVKDIEFYYTGDERYDGKLFAIFKEGGCYSTDYTSLYVCLRFLDRPVFQGLNLRICFAHKPTINFTIGGEKHKQILKMNHEEFVKNIIR